MPAHSPRPRAWSIRARLLLLVFAVWLPAVAGFGLLARSTYEREERAARTRVQELAEALNSAVERELDKRSALLRALSASSALRDGDFGRFQAEARTATRGTGDWVVLVEPGRQLLNTLLERPQVLPRPAGAPFLASGSGVYFTPSGSLRKAPVVGIFAPEAQVQPPRYNVAVVFEPAAIQAVVAEREYPAGTLASVTDREFRVMGRSRDLDKWLGSTASPSMQRRIAEGVAGFAPSVTLDGVASLTYVSRPNHHGWAVVMALPTSALTASARRLTLQASMASGALLLIGLALALYAARRITAPVQALQRAAADLGGNAVPAVLTTGVTETDAVSRAMHEAGARLQESGRVQQQRVEEAVRAAELAQARLLEGQKHEAIGRLTGGLAHDFNNLLQTIRVGLELADRADPQARHNRAVKAAVNACTKAAELVRHMLAFGRSQPLHPQPVALPDFLLKSQELTRKALGERIELALELAPDLPPVLTDPNQLELAVLNLLFNARDAMPQGGRIVVAVRRAGAEEAASLPPGHGYVALSVADAGTGMDAATQARVFEPYFTTKPVGAGSGLGLPQVLAFARQSGGDVRLASSPGQGTRVTLLLPESALAVPAAAAEGPEARPGRPLRVLMVEDDLLVASVVVPALESAGHAVALCTTGSEAVGRLSVAADFDVVFSDVVMPGAVGGLELARWCRDHHPALPVLLATGYSAQPIEGVARVLRKPYAIDAVLRAIQEVAETDRAPG